jgi:hypothetical protein
MRLLESYVFEVLRTSDKTDGGVKDNISFVRDAFYKKGSMSHFKNFDWSERSREYDGTQFIVRECKELVVVFMMAGEDPAGYVALDRFGGGVKIETLAVGMEYRNGAAKKIYSFIVDEFGKLYSDDNQTPQARGLWNSLFKSGKFKMYAVDTRDGMKKYKLKSMEKDGDLSTKELGIVGLTDKHSRSRYMYGNEDTKTSERILICIEK